MKKIYLAGPLGFSEAGRAFHNGQLIPLLAEADYHVLDPWTLTDPRKIAAVEAMPYGPEHQSSLKKLNAEVAANNVHAIDEAHGILAVLDGTDVDSGTAAEIGYAFARGRPILGYRGDRRLWADNHGAIVNLQVEYFIRTSGGDIVNAIKDIKPALTRMLARSGRDL